MKKIFEQRFGCCFGNGNGNGEVCLCALCFIYRGLERGKLIKELVRGNMW